MALVVIILFLVACFLPAIRFGEGARYLLGWECLVYGFFVCPLWLPNPLVFAGLLALTCGRNRLALVLGALACLSTLQLVCASELRKDSSWGCYVWLADVYLFTAAAGVMTGVYGARPGWIPPAPPADPGR